MKLLLSIVLLLPVFIIASPYKKVPSKPMEIKKISSSKFKERNGYVRCSRHQTMHGNCNSCVHLLTAYFQTQRERVDQENEILIASIASTRNQIRDLQEFLQLP